MSASPTSRTIKALEEMGYVVDIAERRITRTVTMDLFGFIDLVAIGPLDADYVERDLIGVQVTSGANHAARRKKILSEPRALMWLETGARIEIHSWRKNAKGKWVERVEEITLEDFE